jgi:biopolymer transport protein ExbB
MDFSLLGLWNQMGLVAKGVVVILLGMSMYAIGIALERFITFRRSRARSLGFIAELQPLMGSSRALERASSLEQRWQDAPLARVVSTGLKEYRTAIEEVGDAARDAVERELLMHSVSRSMERARKREMAALSRGLPALATISSSAPFVGLFGTTFGIITAFRQMADPGSGGGGGLATVSAGIAEALMTTAVGLGVAIVAVWLFNFFTTRMNDMGVLMDDATGELADRLLRLTRTEPSAADDASSDSSASRPPAQRIEEKTPSKKPGKKLPQSE